MGSPDSTEILTQMKSLIETQIPEQSKSLSDNVENLEKVAQYCEDIYVNSKDADKQHLLNETKSYTTQALASVAYQIHVLANSFLMLLDNQSMLLDDINDSLKLFNHEVTIHKEKVGRREVGNLTSNKCVVRTLKAKKTDLPEKPIKYVRKPIDYSKLDDVGHGIKLADNRLNIELLNRLNPNNSLSSSMTSLNSSISTFVESKTSPKANHKSNSSIYAYSNLRPIKPPTIPVHMYESAVYSSKRDLNISYGSESSGYSTNYSYSGSMSNLTNDNSKPNKMNSSMNCVRHMKSNLDDI